MMVLKYHVQKLMHVAICRVIIESDDALLTQGTSVSVYVF